ncbi:MAG: outer membrane PBP1 activator LpoA protein [Methylophagaceae bacterium]|jgi:outer membrane PBP1 activator LpoA protein
MALVQGNNIMAKTTFSTFLALLTAAGILAGCSDSETDTQTDKPAITQNEEAVDLDILIEQAETSRAEANKLGFEWSVTMPLLEEAHAAAKAGNQEQAIALFKEVKYQSMLAIEQAHYAEQHWELLIPSK